MDKSTDLRNLLPNNHISFEQHKANFKCYFFMLVFFFVHCVVRFAICTNPKSYFAASVPSCVQISSTLQQIQANICLKVQNVYSKWQSFKQSSNSLFETGHYFGTIKANKWRAINELRADGKEFLSDLPNISSCVSAIKHEFYHAVGF